jgi:hypothetical protein
LATKEVPVPVVEISEETFNFLKDLGAEVARQDNRCTASPYFIALRKLRKYPVPEEYSHDGSWFVDKHAQSWDTKEELLENDPNHKESEITEIFYKEHPEVENVFFTDRGFNEHMRLNRHNIGKHDNFLYHAFRNPEFDGLFKALAEFKDLTPIVVEGP